MTPLSISGPEVIAVSFSLFPYVAPLVLGWVVYRLYTELTDLRREVESIKE
ncbi:hypothetical protein [Haloferax mucosum]|uniref:hypothetical protein n=1 Tax=Haloferax mucosum TaxID=403181 RepID=UPI000326C320|nr:hypothetical protein [Haloferax mucosum]